MVKSRRSMKYGDDFSRKCQNCKRCKPIKDDKGNIVMHACSIDGQPLGNVWPIHITTCDKFIQMEGAVCQQMNINQLEK